MQGYIIDVHNVRDEDLIVRILTKNHAHKAYRFYGARHSNINLGYKIDFELHSGVNSKLSQLRNVIALTQNWYTKIDHMLTWQNFVQLLDRHIKDIEELDSFYFDMLELASQKMYKQNPKRIIIESYLDLLEFEGRLQKEENCFICEEKLSQNAVLVRGFLQACENCVLLKGMSKKSIYQMFESKSTMYLEDEQVQKLYKIVCEGL